MSFYNVEPDKESGLFYSLCLMLSDVKFNCQWIVFFMLKFDKQSYVI